jgi:hypothetical protein
MQAARRASSSGTRTRRRGEGEAAAARGCECGDRPARSARSMGCRRPFQNRIFGGEKEEEWWDPRVGKQNRETAGANCVLRMKIFLLHP